MEAVGQERRFLCVTFPSSPNWTVSIKMFSTASIRDQFDPLFAILTAGTDEKKMLDGSGKWQDVLLTVRFFSLNLRDFDAILVLAVVLKAKPSK
jgi:hypothetical protein